MTQAAATAESLIDAIIPVLDRETELLDARREQLAQLLRATLERNEKALGPLLEEIEKTLERQANTDRELSFLRSRLAEKLNRPLDQVRLASLVESLDEPRRSEILDRRRRIVKLTDALRDQHLRTALVVSECAKLNRMLLEALFPRAKGLTTYGTRGGSRWDTGVGVVDVES